MYKVFNGKNWLEFSSYDFLLNWLAQYNTGLTITTPNTFLCKVGHNPNDTYRSVSIEGGRSSYGYSYLLIQAPVIEYKQRNCRIVDENGNSIYNKKLVHDVIHYKHDKNKLRLWHIEINSKGKAEYYSNRRYRCLPDSAYPEFRRGPWPFIHKPTFRWNYRKIRTTQERRMTCNKESIPFNRASRAFNLPDLWSDDPMRDWRDSGWKSQSKNRHQWENKVKQKVKHTCGKNTYVAKRNSIRQSMKDIELMMDDIEEIEEVNELDNVA